MTHIETRHIGSKIAAARKKINLSQAQLSQHLFISAQAVGKWERGESLPDIITLIRLAGILGVDLNYFSDNMQAASTEIAPAEPLVMQQAELNPGEPKKKPGWDMSRGSWVDADFSGLKDLHDRFSASNMQRCLFTGSGLSRLLLRSNNIDNCDFSGSDISSSKIQYSSITDSMFRECSLKETEFSGSHINGCDFSGADFTGATIKSGAFVKNIITNAMWNRTSFIDAQITDITFDGTMEDCSFENCAFARVTFQNSKLLNTFFKNKSLRRIRFIDCQADRITYAFLKNGKASLTGITLITP